MMWLWVFIAKRWIRKSADADKKELIATKHFILKGERKHEIDPIEGVKLIRTFSIHRHKSPSTSWEYEKYILNQDGTYEFLRGGKYPYEWE